MGDVDALVGAGAQLQLLLHEVQLTPPAGALSRQPPAANAKVDRELAIAEGLPQTSRARDVAIEGPTKSQEPLEERQRDGLRVFHPEVADPQREEPDARRLEASQRVAGNLRCECLEEVYVRIESERALRSKLALDVRPHLQKNTSERLLSFLEALEVQRLLDARDVEVHLVVAGAVILVKIAKERELGGTELVDLHLSDHPPWPLLEQPLRHGDGRHLVPHLNDEVHV
mmetsp:Transcript_91114/g.257989  ORF Transcript_91114/g.257989 Transcript_91114/m.257989 type:complete len:229 (-) Transcript_91114:433-1119(-)